MDSEFEQIFDLLGLSPSERRILMASKMARSVHAISRITHIPQTSLPYMLSKLEQRGLMKKIGSGRKQVVWMSNLTPVLRKISRLFTRIRMNNQSNI